ncbi:MAG TPA: TetR/AcrR family transcriptional regulator [Gammaproteobacteria bacterium]|nr:TetR/AcrR family transcriptional regulator [Gammaproteobacteria bacterium]
MSKRKYTLKQRAEQQQETHDRIVEAAMALHESLGPRNTSISAIAEQAGVQRLTVYRHFASDEELYEACTSRWLELNPPPDPARWQSSDSPLERCEKALSELYTYYRGTERMWQKAYRDLEEVPAFKPAMDEFAGYLRSIRDDLAAGWKLPAAKKRALKQTLDHLLQFSTWQQLAGQGLSDRQMVNLVSRWIAAVV